MKRSSSTPGMIKRAALCHCSLLEPLGTWTQSHDDEMSTDCEIYRVTGTSAFKNSGGKKMNQNKIEIERVLQTSGARYQRLFIGVWQMKEYLADPSKFAAVSAAAAPAAAPAEEKKEETKVSASIE